MDEKEAEIRADMKLGKLNAVGRVILFSDTRAADDRSHWEVVDVADLARLPSYVNKDHKMTPEERVMRSKLPYTSGAEHTSRIFARVSADVSKIDALRIMKCGPEDLWDTCRRAKMSSRDAYYRVVDRYPKDAIFKGYTYPQVDGKYISEEYLRGRPTEVTAASSAEEDPGMVSVPLEEVQPRRVASQVEEQDPLGGEEAVRALVAQMDNNNNINTGHVTVMDGAVATQVPVIQVPEKIIELARQAGVDLSPHVTQAPAGATEPTIFLPDGSIVEMPKGGATPEGGIRQSKRLADKKSGAQQEQSQAPEEPPQPPPSSSGQGGGAPSGAGGSGSGGGDDDPDKGKKTTSRQGSRSPSPTASSTHDLSDSEADEAADPSVDLQKITEEKEPSEEEMEVEEEEDAPTRKRPKFTFKTLNDHLRTPKFTPQGKRNMNHLMASRAKERMKRRAEEKGVSKGTNKDKECIPGCDCEYQSLESIRAMCTEPMEHMMFVYIDKCTKRVRDQIDTYTESLTAMHHKLDQVIAYCVEKKEREESLVEGERRDEQEVEDRKMLGLDEDRKWHSTDPKHFVEENKRPLIRILYNELKAVNLPHHWVRTCLKTLFVKKVYRRFFMKEQKRSYGRIIRWGQEFYVMPEYLIKILHAAVSKVHTGIDFVKAKKNVQTYTSAQREQALREMKAEVQAYRSESMVAHLVYINEIHELRALKEEAPIWHSRETKEAMSMWVGANYQKVKDAYLREHGGDRLPDQPSNKRCREKFLETINTYTLKGKIKKAKEKYKNFLAGGALPPALEEGQEASTDEDEEDLDKSASTDKGRKKKSPTPKA